MLLKELKKGDYFKLVNSRGIISTTIYKKQHYIKSEKKYSCCNVNDINAEKFIKENQLITTEFCY